MADVLPTRRGTRLTWLHCGERSNFLADDLRRIEFRVSDTGIGISADKLERLFKPLSQVSGSTAHRYGGTGPGLAISRRLCEMMRSGISAPSSGVEGAGSTFKFDVESREPVSAALKSAFDDEATGLDTLVSSPPGTGEFDMQMGADTRPNVRPNVAPTACVRQRCARSSTVN